MNRQRFFWFVPLLLLVAACQPISPPTSADTVPSAETTVITGTAAVTNTVTITATDTPTVAGSIMGSASTADERPRPTPTASTPPSTSSNGDRAAVATCPALTGQALDTIVSAQWQEGEQRFYRIHQRRTDIDGDDENAALSATTPVTVTVVSVEEEGYVLEWSFGRSELGEFDLDMPETVAALMQAPLEIVFQYSTDEDGAYDMLLNVDELQAQIDPLIDQVFAAFAEADDSLDPEALAAARTMVEGLFSDPANFETLFTREVQLFHTLHGFYFESAEPFELPDMRPNLLGGAPIPSVLTVTPVGYDVEFGCLHVEFENVADPVAARNSILEALQNQARQMGVPAPTEDDLPAELEIVDTVRFEMDLNSGWPLAIYAERSTELGDQGRLETTEFVLVE